MTTTRLGIRDVCMYDLLKEYTILGHIRSGFFGDVYAVSKTRDGGRQQLQLHNKYTSLPRYRGKKFEFVMKVSPQGKATMDEIKIMYLLQKTKCPHLPSIISHHRCKDVMFRGWKKSGVALSYLEEGDWTFVKRGKGVITIMENSGVGMDLYIKTNTSFANEVNMVFQLAYTLHVLEQSNKISHNDIYMQNITCKQVNETSMTYVVNNQQMEIQILDGRIPVLIDFGQAVVYKRKSSKVDQSDLAMMLKTWGHYTTLPIMKRFLEMVRGDYKEHKRNTQDFLVNYFNKYIFRFQGVY